MITSFSHTRQGQERSHSSENRAQRLRRRRTPAQVPMGRTCDETHRQSLVNKNNVLVVVQPHTTTRTTSRSVVEGHEAGAWKGLAATRPVSRQMEESDRRIYIVPVIEPDSQLLVTHARSVYCSRLRIKHTSTSAQSSFIAGGIVCRLKGIKQLHAKSTGSTMDGIMRRKTFTCRKMGVCLLGDSISSQLNSLTLTKPWFLCIIFVVCILCPSFSMSQASLVSILEVVLPLECSRQTLHEAFMTSMKRGACRALTFCAVVLVHVPMRTCVAREQVT